VTGKPLDPNLHPLVDDGLLIPMGAYAGITSLNQYGRNPSCAAGAEEEIWNGSEVYSWPATALMTKLSQTTDQEALRGETVHIHGLDGNWDLVEQDVVLNGTLTTTPVVLATPLIRVFFAEVNADTLADSTIRLHNDAENVDYLVMPVGNNTTALGWYTVPAGKTAYMTNYWAHHNPATGATFTSNLIRLRAVDNANGYASKVVHQRGVPEDSGFRHPFTPYRKFTEKTDLYLTSAPVGAAADVSAGFDLILVDN